MACCKNMPDANRNLGQEFNLTLKGQKQHFGGQGNGLVINCRISFSSCAEWRCNAYFTQLWLGLNKIAYIKKRLNTDGTEQLFPLFFFMSKTPS